MTHPRATPLHLVVPYRSAEEFFRGEGFRVSAAGLLLREEGRVAIGESVLLRVEFEGEGGALVAEAVARTLPDVLHGERGQWLAFRRFDSATKEHFRSALAAGLTTRGPVAPGDTVAATSSTPGKSVAPSQTADKRPSSTPEGRGPEIEDSGIRDRPSRGTFSPPSATKRESLLAKLRTRTRASQLPPAATEDADNDADNVVAPRRAERN